MAASQISSLPRVYIDGQSGPVGLRIRSMLAARLDLQLLEIDKDQRRDAEARKKCLCEADVAVLCLPDDAAREAVALAEHASTRFLDGSTAHRVAEGWVYGLPELQPSQREAIARARYVANPGCWPTGIILLLRPLIEAGLLGPGVPLSIHGVSGYTGGGKDMVARWEDATGPLPTLPFSAPYAMGKRHKHIPEMTMYSGLSQAPAFCPSVGAFACGMRVQIPIHHALLPKNANSSTLLQALQERYAQEPAIMVREPAEILAHGELALR